MKRYEFIEHTADVGVKVWGTTLIELFENASYAMFSIISDLDSVGETISRSVEVSAPNCEELLVEWLRELLYISTVKDIIFKRFKIDELSETRLIALCYGEPMNPDRHELRTEVKTVTYHQLYVRQLSRGWEAQIVFDI